MSHGLEGKRVLVTGASAGIGRAAAKAFAEAGAVVLATARSAAGLATLSSEIGGPPRIETYAIDVTDAPAMESLAARILAAGAPDVIVANAGLGMDAPFVATDDSAWRRIFDVNVFGVVRTVRPYLEAMIARGSGRVLLISSAVGKRGVPSYSAYSASKFALHGMADALRPELVGTGVSVGIICPSSTTTEFEDRKLRNGPQQVRVRVKRHSAESVARAIVRMATSTRREIVLSPEAKLMSALSRLAPGFMDRMLAKVLVPKT
jgi:short-subunit dehydrogenase